MADEPVVNPADGQPNQEPNAQVGNRDWIDAEYRGEKCLESIPDKKTLIKNYIESQKFIGGSVRIPGEKATPEEWAKFYAKTGRPETPEGYEFQAGELPDGKKIDEKLQANFAKWSHDLGLSKKQAQDLMTRYTSHVVEELGAKQAERAVTVDSLRKDWGSLFDRNLALAKRAVREFGGEELASYLDETGLGNHAHMVRMFARIGQNLMEDKLSMDGDTGAVLTASTAKQKIAAVQGDPKHPYFHADHPGHKQAVQDMADLYRAAYDQP